MNIKKAIWKDYLISLLFTIAVLYTLLRAKEYTSGYNLFLQYAVVGLFIGAAIDLAVFFIKKEKLLLCLSAILFVLWFVFPAEGPMMSGLLGCAISTLISSVPALASFISAFPSNKKE